MQKMPIWPKRRDECMACRGVDRGGQGNKHPTFKVQMTIVVVPVREGGVREEGGAFFKSSENT